MNEEDGLPSILAIFDTIASEDRGMNYTHNLPHEPFVKLIPKLSNSEEMRNAKKLRIKNLEKT